MQQITIPKWLTISSAPRLSSADNAEMCKCEEMWDNKPENNHSQKHMDNGTSLNNGCTDN